MEAMASSQYDSKRGSRVIARVFALLALAVVTIVLVAVISSSLDSSSNPTTSSTTTASQPSSKPKDDYYVVKSGDTFSGIAAKEGVSRAKLLRLNQNRGIDPEVLQPLQCVDIVAGGCKQLSGG